MATMAVPLSVQAICFINQKAPGVHETTNPKTGEKYWTNSNGDYLCSSEEALPIDKIDQFVFFNGDKSGNNPYVHKEWDPERKTWVWKDTTGNFLGRDPESVTEEDMEWMAKEDPNWFVNNDLPWVVHEKLLDVIYEQQTTEAIKQQVQQKESGAQTTQTQDGKSKSDAAAAQQKLQQADQQMEMTDAEVQQALSEIQKARAELKAAGASEYGGYLDEAEAAIRQAQAASRQYKQKRGR